jgi:DNA-binding transcriptional regulator WhiA
MDKRTITQSVCKEIVDRYNNGESPYKICTDYNITPSAVYYHLNKSKIQIRKSGHNSRKYNFDNDYFKSIDNDEKAYWLGFIIADGYIQNRGLHIELSIVDIDHLEKFKSAINSQHPIKITHDGKACRISIFSNKLLKTLAKYNIIANKSLKISLPNIDNKLYSSLIRGFFDGDGCITKSKKDWSIVFSSGSNEFLLSIKNIINNSINRNCGSLRKQRIDKNTYTLSYGGNIIVSSIMSYMYDKATVFLNRKYDKYVLSGNKYQTSMDT